MTDLKGLLVSALACVDGVELGRSSGFDIAALSKALGHSYLMVTSVYLRGLGAM